MQTRGHSLGGRVASEVVVVLLVALLTLAPLGSAAAVPGATPAAGASLLVPVAGWPAFSDAAAAERAAGPGGVSQPAALGSANSSDAGGAAGLSPADAATREKVKAGLGKLPLYFVENRGQIDARAAYYVQGSRTSVYFTKTGLVYALASRAGESKDPAGAEARITPASFSPRDRDRESQATRRHAIRLDFEGANPDVKLSGQDRTEALVSYFKGQPSEWKTALPTYRGVVYKELWPGIDLVYGGETGKLKYSFVVKPGADPSRIRLVYRGASAVRLTEAGRLSVETTAGSFEEDVPYAYQEDGGTKTEVHVDFEPAAAEGGGEYRFGFRVGAYDNTRTLVLDPVVLAYCGYIGGAGSDQAIGIAVDGVGNAYVTGLTFSSEASFPEKVGPDLTYNLGKDAFVAKVNAGGTALVYCGYIGGSGDEYGYAIAVDGSGNAYVTGATNSTAGQGFPVSVGPDLTQNGVDDAFVAKINAAGTALVYCGYIGGSQWEYGYGIAVDGAGNAYVTGFTFSTEAQGFPVSVGPDLTHNGGGEDAFVAKVNAAGTALVYCGFIGGSASDYGYDVAVDGSGSAYVTGSTSSTAATFPETVGPDLTQNGLSDVFVAKVNAAGTALVYCGYIGGSGDEGGHGIAVDSAGNAYVSGATNSTEASFPVAVGPDLSYNGGAHDGFVAKVNAAGTALVYAGYIGGSGDDYTEQIAVDAPGGNAYVTGSTNSTEAQGFPVAFGPDVTQNGGDDVFVAKVSAAGTALVYCGYIGGSGGDYAYGIAVDAAGSAYVTGIISSTEAQGFPVTVGPDLTYNGGPDDGFVAKILADGCCALSTAEVPDSTITVTGAGQFEMRFNTTSGGSVDQFFDLAEDPGKTLNLAGGDGGGTVPARALFYDAISNGVNYDWSVGNQGNKVDLLEATATRVRVRQESFYQNSTGTAIRPGIKGLGDHTIYGIGRHALRWQRKTTSIVTIAPCCGSDLDLVAHATVGGPLGTWVAEGASGPLPQGPGEAFLLERSNYTATVPNVKTDFLMIMNGTWPQATGTGSGFWGAGSNVQLAYWIDNNGEVIPANVTQTLNFLTYFKPTNFTAFADPAVISRSSDYRGPATPVINGGKGSQWQDANEDSSTGGDFFNESEAAYVFNLDPSLGLDFNIDGTTTTRYSPFFKIRQWRSLAPPQTITVDGVTRSRNVHYKATVKPVSRAAFMKKLLWYSTLESVNAITVSPDVGSAKTTTIPAGNFVAARYGNGATVTAAGTYIAITVTDGAGAALPDFDKAQGAVEFWFQPTWASTDNNTHDLAGLISSVASNQILFQKLNNAGGNNLLFSIQAGGTNSDCQVSGATYSWNASDWVHLRFEWDETAPAASQQRIYVNGVLKPCTATPTDYVAANLNLGVNGAFWVGNINNGANVSGFGIYDELYIYGGSSVPSTALANGGLVGSSREYLADTATNFTLSFSGVDAVRRGEFLYLGADSQFRGLNVGLSIPGAGVASGDLDWEYWNGTAWANLELVGGFGDTTNSFTRTGNVFWTSDPSTWAPYSVNGGPELYYVRVHLKAGSTYTTPPAEGVITTDILLFQDCGDVTTNSNFVFAAPVPTAVKLESFTAAAGDSTVLLSWRTGSELDNLGFYLYRALSDAGPWTRLNASLIPGLGSSALGQAYSFRDTGLQNWTRYFYRLEDVDASSKVTSHGPVSAVPVAGAASGAPGSEPESSGVKKKGVVAPSCPDWVQAAYGSMAGVSAFPAALTCTRHGDPEAVSLGVVSRDSRSATLELKTGGFYALREASGQVRVFVPGFDFPQDPQAPTLPFRRALVGAVVGRRAQLGGVRALDQVTFKGLVPASLGKAEMQVSRDGTVRAGRRAVGESAPQQVSTDLARLLPSVFQGDAKSAVVVLTPLRYDSRRQQIVLSRRLLVRLLFTGRETAEIGSGRFGRRERPEKPITGELLARLYTTERGLHAVSFDELLPGRQQGIASSQLRLERQGQAQGFHLEPASGSFGPGSTLYFYADTTASSTDFSSEMAWELLRARDGLPMPLVSAPPSGSAVTAASTGRASFELNRFYQPGLLDAPELWLWEALGSGTTRAKSFSLSGVDAASSQGAQLEVSLQGASESGNPVDHHVSVSLNGTPVGEAQFAGKKPYRMSLSAPQSLLHAGANELELTNVADTGVSSLVFLDRFTVSYPQTSTLASGVFEGTWAETGTATVSGVASPVALLDVTGSPASRGGSWLTGYESAGSALRFRAEAGHRYFAVSRQALLTPRVAAAAPSSLRATTNQADYLLIAPRAFLTAAEPLLARRHDQGLTTRAVAFEEISDEFGHGQPSAEAIKGFLSFAFQSWARPSPRYVLLLGDSTYDPRNFIGTSQPSPLPALWIKTDYLWTVSDPELAAVNGDDVLPDLAIGRLPATTVEEAQKLVEKLIAWEESGQGLSGQAALVADNPDLAGDFEANARDIALSFLPGRSQLLLLRELGAGTRPAIQDALDSGLSLLSYVGHGGAAVWASENVWNSWDAASLLPQSQEPLLLTLNCLNGYFVAPAFDSLSESLLKVEGRGAIAAFSPSGLSLDGPAHQYHRALMAELTSGRHERLGDAVLAAQRAYAQAGLMPELLGVYHLLGDPATRIR